MEVTGPFSLCLRYNTLTTAGHELQHWGDLSPWVPGALPSRSQALQWPLCVCAMALQVPTPPGGTGQITQRTANPERKTKHMTGGWVGAMHRWGTSTRAGQVWQSQHAQHQDKGHSTPGPCCQCRNVLSLMVTEIRSLLGAQARLALPWVLSGNQALIDLYLTSAFKILCLWSNKH